MYQPVSGVYAKLRQRGSHWIVWGATVVRDDDVSTGRIDDQADLVAIDQSYNYNAGFWGTNEAWMVYYDIIKVANAALEALDNYAVNIVSEADGKRYEEYTGEVKFIRAYCYYRLTELFGPVTILRDNKQTDMTRSTVNAVYRYMLSDLEYSMTYLPRIRPNEYTDRIGAVSAFTAEMLAAKVYMEQGNWSEVERLTDDIIGSKKFSLYSDFNNLFKIPGKLCDESLFEMQFTDFGNGSGEVVVSDSWFTFQGPLNDGNISGLRGGWVMCAEDIKGLTPEQIQQKFALPSTPKYIGEVKLKAGSNIRMGEVNPNYGFNGGGIQFDLKGQYIGEFKEIGSLVDWSMGK